MSRTYKYARETLNHKIVRKESDASQRMKKKLELRKQQRKKKIRTNRSFKKFISFRDKQWARV